MVIFHSYVSLPEGSHGTSSNRFEPHSQTTRDTPVALYVAFLPVGFVDQHGSVLTLRVAANHQVAHVFNGHLEVFQCV